MLLGSAIAALPIALRGLETLRRPEAPPVCPKCGSHRTEVIGKTETDKAIVRCHACGTISKTAKASS
jgi:tRNA(Ile2) C34 agmatinyltransferase TiaS